MRSAFQAQGRPPGLLQGLLQQAQEVLRTIHSLLAHQFFCFFLYPLLILDMIVGRKNHGICGQKNKYRQCICHDHGEDRE